MSIDLVSVAQLQFKFTPHIEVKEKSDDPFHPDRRGTMSIAVDSSGDRREHSQLVQANSTWQNDGNQKRCCRYPANDFNQQLVILPTQ